MARERDTKGMLRFLLPLIAFAGVVGTGYFVQVSIWHDIAEWFWQLPGPLIVVMFIGILFLVPYIKWKPGNFLMLAAKLAIILLPSVAIVDYFWLGDKESFYFFPLVWNWEFLTPLGWWKIPVLVVGPVAIFFLGKKILANEKATKIAGIILVVVAVVYWAFFIFPGSDAWNFFANMKIFSGSDSGQPIIESSDEQQLQDEESTGSTHALKIRLDELPEGRFAILIKRFSIEEANEAAELNRNLKGERANSYVAPVGPKYKPTGYLVLVGDFYKDDKGQPNRQASRLLEELKKKPYLKKFGINKDSLKIYPEPPAKSKKK